VVGKEPYAKEFKANKTVSHFVYILKSYSTDKYYVGSSIDPYRRLTWHNKGTNKSTRGGVPWRLEHVISCQTKSDALKLEKFIKRQKSRKFIERVINGEKVIMPR